MTVGAMGSSEAVCSWFKDNDLKTFSIRQDALTKTEPNGITGINVTFVNPKERDLDKPS